ncbi:MAG: flagellin [Proteobacteria bacterium]|nr:flagellin [Pseudomonadota bacterium]
MSRVSTAYAFQRGAADFLRVQSKHVEANRQIADGKRAVDLKGFGRQSETLIAAKTVEARANGFVEMHKILTGRLEAQNLALERVADVADQSRQLVMSVISSERADSLLKTLDSLFGQAADALNYRHEGRFLFAGSQLDTEPVAITTMAGLTAAPATAEAFNNDETRTQSRLSETATLTTGFLADELGTELFEVFKSVQAYHEGPNGPLSGTLTQDQTNFLKGKLGEFIEVHDNLLGQVAENGLMQNRVDDARDGQSKRATNLRIFIADTSEIDYAEAISRLQQAELAIQASAAALKSLKESSLLNFLPV